MTAFLSLVGETAREVRWSCPRKTCASVVEQQRPITALVRPYSLLVGRYAGNHTYLPSLLYGTVMAERVCQSSERPASHRPGRNLRAFRPGALIVLVVWLFWRLVLSRQR